MPKETFDNNKPIIRKLFLAELAAATGMQYTQMLVNVYRAMPERVREEAFMNALYTVAGMANIPDKEIDKGIEDHGGIDNVIEMMEQSSTLGLAPDSNHLYVMKDENLGTPAGEYRIGESVYSDQGVFLIVQKSNLAGYVDWAFGVPNFSWIGAFEPMPPPTQGLLEATMTEAEWIAFNKSKGTPSIEDIGGNGGGDITPLIMAGIGFAVGGPIGALVGLVAGSMGKGGSSSESKAPVTPESPVFVPSVVGKK